MIKNIFIGLLVVSLLVVSGCSEKPQEEIKIGVIGPFTGVIADLGEDMTQSFEMVFEEVGEVNGKKVKLIYEDTKCNDLSGMISALNKLKEINNVVAVLGPFCGTTNKIAGEFSTQNKMFIISPGDNFGKTGEYKINTRYLIDKEAKLMGEYIINKGWRKVAILYFNNDWGLEYRNNVKEYIENYNGEIVGEEIYDFVNLDVRTQLLKIEDTNPEVLIIIDATRGSLFRQVRELGIDIPLVSEWEIETATEEDVIRSFEDVVFFSPVNPRTDFYNNFEIKYGESPNPVHVNSYDAAILMVESLKACPNSDPDCMIEFVTNIKNYPGANGPLTFDRESWSFEQEFLAKTIKDGKFVILEN